MVIIIAVVDIFPEQIFQKMKYLRQYFGAITSKSELLWFVYRILNNVLDIVLKSYCLLGMV